MTFLSEDFELPAAKKLCQSEGEGVKSYIPSQGESIQDFGKCGIGGWGQTQHGAKDCGSFRIVRGNVGFESSGP